MNQIILSPDNTMEDLAVEENYSNKSVNSNNKVLSYLIILVIIVLIIIGIILYFLFSNNQNTYVEAEAVSGQLHNIKINVYEEKSKYSKFTGSDIIIIDFSNYKNIGNLWAVNVDLSKYNISNSILDIYKDENGDLQKYATVTMDSGKHIKFLPNEETKYILIYIPVKSINLIEKEIIINKGDTYFLEPSIDPAYSTNKNLVYKAEDASIIGIDSTGHITAKQVGTSKLTVSVENEKNIEKDITVVVQDIAADIQLANNAFTLEQGQTDNIQAAVLPADASDTSIKYVSLDENIVQVDDAGKITAVSPGQTTIRVQSGYNPQIEKDVAITVKAKPKPPAAPPSPITADKNAAPNPANTGTQTNNTPAASDTVTGITYINGILLVNKQHPLPSTYKPGVNAAAQGAFNTMQKDAQNEGISLFIVSGFRSYADQTAIYNKNVQLYGAKVANTFSAKPGESEHQTGLAFDVNSTQSSFGTTKEGIWLAQNCYKYGFIIRYPQGKEDITGYVYEPWHIRYVGTSAAADIYNSGITLEEYLGM